MVNRKRGSKSKSSFPQKYVMGIALGLTIVLLLVGAFFFFQGKSSLTGYAAVNTISFMKAGESLFFEVGVAGVEYLEFTFAQDIQDAVITTEEVKTINWDFEGIAYSRFRISSADEDKIGNTVFTLKIKEVELKDLGLAVKDVKLYANSKEAETTLLKTEGDYVFYTAKSTGLGDYVIGTAAAPVSTKIVPEVVPVTPESNVEVAPVETVPAKPVVEETPQSVESSDGFFQNVADFFSEMFS